MAKAKAKKAKAKGKATGKGAKAKKPAAKKAKAKPAAKGKSKASVKAKAAREQANAKAREQRAEKRAAEDAKLREYGAEMAAKRAAKVFECSDLALCAMEALVQQGLVKAEVRVPELAPEDDDDLDDESESWRDRVVDNQTQPIETLVAQLAQHRDKLARITEITGVLIDVAEEYEPEIWSLAGIEACTGLEKIDLWSRDEKLDLSPLAALPKLVEIDLTCASDVRDVRPLLAIASLKKVIGTIDDRTADELRRRGVEVATKSP